MGQEFESLNTHHMVNVVQLVERQFVALVVVLGIVAIITTLILKKRKQMKAEYALSDKKRVA